LREKESVNLLDRNDWLQWTAKMDSLEFGMKAQKESDACMICGISLIHDGILDGAFVLNAQGDHFVSSCKECFSVIQAQKGFAK
jgi:hypothetical protein